MQTKPIPLEQQFQAKLQKIEEVQGNGRNYLFDTELETDVKTINDAIDKSNLSNAQKNNLKVKYFDINQIKKDSEGNGFDSEEISSLELLKRNLTNAIEYLKETKDKEEGTQKDADEFCKKSNDISYPKIAATTLVSGASIGFFGWTMFKMSKYESQYELENRKFKILNKMLGNDEQLSAESVAELNKELTSIEDKIQHATSEEVKLAISLFFATIGVSFAFFTILEGLSLLCQKKFKDEDKNKPFDLTTKEGREAFKQTFEGSLQQTDLDKTKGKEIKEPQSKDQATLGNQVIDEYTLLSDLVYGDNAEAKSELDGKLQTDSKPKNITTRTSPKGKTTTQYELLIQ